MVAWSVAASCAHTHHKNRCTNQPPLFCTVGFELILGTHFQTPCFTHFRGVLAMLKIGGHRLVCQKVPILGMHFQTPCFVHFKYPLEMHKTGGCRLVSYCQDHVQLQSLIQLKDRLVRNYSYSTDPARTSHIIPSPGLALCMLKSHVHLAQYVNGVHTSMQYLQPRVV